MDNLRERDKQVFDLLSETPTIGVTELAERLGVSVVTARADLDGLADKGYIVRVHGGALPAFHPDIVARQKDHTDVKRRIARAAAAMVDSGDSIMIESGTTPALIARYLMGKQDIRVVTDSTLILPYARTNPGLSVVFAGGRFDSTMEAMVGPVTLRELATYNVRIAFLGTDGFSVPNGLTSGSVEAAEVSRTMAAQADQVVLVADSSKLNRKGFTAIMGLDQVDVLVTDRGLPANEIKEIEALGCRVQLV